MSRFTQARCRLTAPRTICKTVGVHYSKTLKSKIYILTCILFGICLRSYGQADSLDCISMLDTLIERQVYTLVDKMPTPVGGDIILFEELKKLKYPQKCGTLNSTILVAFIVDTSGQLIGKRIIKDIEGTDLADQVLTLIDNITWTIGSCNDKPVPVLFQMPIKISLTE